MTFLQIKTVSIDNLAEFYVNAIHKLIAGLVKPNLVVKILVGMTIAAFTLSFFRPSDEELRNLIGNIGYPTVVLMPTTWIFIIIFYTDCKGIYKSPVEQGWHFGYLGYDPDFYRNITSNNSLLNKLVGYVYALSKIFCSLGIGFELAACLYQIYY